MMSIEANPFHKETDCDETCHGCPACYLATGKTDVCGRACEHWRDNSPTDVDRLAEEDARAGAARDGFQS